MGLSIRLTYTEREDSVLSLPYPTKVVLPFDIATAQDMNERHANDVALAAGTGLADGSVTRPKVDWSTFDKNIKAARMPSISSPPMGDFNLAGDGASLSFTVSSACKAMVTVDLTATSISDFEFKPLIYVGSSVVVRPEYIASPATSASRSTYRGVSGVVSLVAGANTISAGVFMGSATGHSVRGGITAAVLGDVTA